MSGFSARSFDAPRERSVPSVLQGHGIDGAEQAITLERLTLVAVVKPHCDGCREFLASDWSELEALEVVVVSHEADEEWCELERPVLIAPEALSDLEVRGAPWYLLIDPSSRRVLTEGVLFSPAQVASEIAPHLLA